MSQLAAISVTPRASLGVGGGLGGGKVRLVEPNESMAITPTDTFVGMEQST